MSYAAHSDYVALYGAIMSPERFDELRGIAKAIIDDSTTGADGVSKTARYFPTDEYSAAAVRRAFCAVIRYLDTADDADSEARHGALRSVSSGSESIGYYAPTGSGDSRFSRGIAIAREQLIGAFDSRGVRLTYMGD